MPTYQYLCAACGHEFEQFQSITAQALRKCPKCAKMRLNRLIGTGGGIIFKGSGFYQTDYRSESYKTAAKGANSSSEGAKTSEKAGVSKENGAVGGKSGVVGGKSGVVAGESAGMHRENGVTSKENAGEKRVLGAKRKKGS